MPIYLDAEPGESAAVFGGGARDAAAPEAHVTERGAHRVEVVVAAVLAGEGDYFAVCGCGWNSGPLPYLYLARDYRDRRGCPVGFAEGERERARRDYGAAVRGGRYVR